MAPAEKEYQMSRLYEVMFIVRPDVVEEDVDKLIAGFTATVTNGGGVVKTVEKMGRRKLAYMVRKFNDGNYVLLTIEANGAVVLELERRLRVTEPVIKFITVRIDEEEKRLAKVKALRGARRKVSAEPVAAAPSLQLRLPRRVAAPAAAEAAEAGPGHRLAAVVDELPPPAPSYRAVGMRPDPVLRGASTASTGTEESKEETPCLKRLKAKAPETSAPAAPQAASGSDSGPGSGFGSRLRFRSPLRRSAPADGPPAAPADAASSSAARRSASSAPRRSTRSLTAMSGCCKGLWPSAARSCPGGSPAFAPRTSAA